MSWVETKNFTAIRLEQMEAVRLMNRLDRKFCIPVTQLSELLERILPYYFILEINGQRCMTYSNVYFDSPDDQMYNDHLRGKNNRYKIRLRTYNESKLSFLEIKRKDNRGKTIKKRVEYNGSKSLAPHADFLEAYSPFSVNSLQPVLHNDFSRITLVAKDFGARCTIDTDISFQEGSKEEALNRLAIIEVKSEGHDKNVPIIKALRDMRHLPAGYSKYCIGRSLLDDGLKNNAYRPKLRELKRIEDSATFFRQKAIC